MKEIAVDMIWTIEVIAVVSYDQVVQLLFFTCLRNNMWISALYDGILVTVILIGGVMYYLRPKISAAVGIRVQRLTVCLIWKIYEKNLKM